MEREMKRYGREPSDGTKMAIEPVSKVPAEPSEFRTFVANWDVVTTCENDENKATRTETN
jgi:hypothetical protein